MDLELVQVGLIACHVALVLVVGPVFLVGITNRVKARWAGRRGPRLNQVWFDWLRLLRKTPVYGAPTSWLFPLAPIVVLASTLTAALVCPVVPGFAPLSFDGDFVMFAYLLGLGRLLLMLGALDTGSSFEGMGASREATYAALAEPSFLLALGTLAWASGSLSFKDLAAVQGGWPVAVTLRAAIAAALLVVLLVESSRVPADDPTTHLELTMVHEVMILDHSGPELAIVQYASAMKMTLLAAVVASLANPFAAGGEPIATVAATAMTMVLLAAIAGGIGLVESLTARLRFRALPLFVLASFLTVAVAYVVVGQNAGATQ